MNWSVMNMIFYEHGLLWSGLLWTWSVMNVVCFEWSILSGLLWAGLFWTVTIFNSLLACLPILWFGGYDGYGTGLIVHAYNFIKGVASSRCKENSAWPFKRAAFDYLNTLSLYTTFSLFKHMLTAHT